MNQTLTTHPPAKLNLFLELLSKRADGFHEIESVMLPIDWCDTLSLRTSDTPSIELSVHAPQAINGNLDSGDASDRGTGKRVEQIPADHRNLVHQALDAFRKSFDIKSGFQCQLTKRIPAGAGLGGASSDAASALMLAAELHGISKSEPGLLQIAAKIGSDVPFFLGCPAPENHQHTQRTNATCPAAYATGRGEILTELQCPSKLFFLVVFPGKGLSTPQVYANSSVPTETVSSRPIIDAMRSGDASTIAANLFNRLEEPAKKLAPEVNIALESMQESGLPGYLMTGSGSACFGMTQDEQTARRAAESFKEQAGPGFTIQIARNTDVPALVH